MKSLRFILITVLYFVLLFINNTAVAYYLLQSLPYNPAAIAKFCVWLLFDGICIIIYADELVSMRWRKK